MTHPKATGRINFKHPMIPPEGFLFDFASVIQTNDIQEVRDLLSQVDARTQAGEYAVGFISYEAAPAFEDAYHVNKTGNLPLIWFGFAKAPKEQYAADLTPPTIDSALSPQWSCDKYGKGFSQAQQHISNGDTYQINLTFPLVGKTPSNPKELYTHLKARQSAQYSGLIETPDFSIVSASPELFFERVGNKIITRPMKGTRRRGDSPEEDQQIRQELAEAAKDRAENVMIVDLLRNDLGRIAETGTVCPTSLFAIEEYPTVWQMTSTVSAQLKPKTNLCDIFQAIFPCGSVTGAPKFKTMEIIAELEDHPRGVYCGAFGIVFPGGDCVFNVPIRTMTLSNGEAIYPVGSGIVADSSAEDEYEECLLKAQVLHSCPEPFRLLETILWEPKKGYFLLDHHIIRLKSSAIHFEFKLSQDELIHELKATAKEWNEKHRVRVLLAPDGTCEIQGRPIPPDQPPIETVRLASRPVSRHDQFLYHKTTRRSIYDRERALLGTAGDAILYNEDGEITESTIANIAIQLDGTWYTPPVECGLLAGTMRREMLAKGQLKERVITINELKSAVGIRLLNSVRGCFDVKLIQTQSQDPLHG